MVGLLAVRIYVGERFIHVERNLMPPASQFLAPNDRDVTLVLMSDTGSNNHVLEHVIDHARAHENPDFMMYLGDFVSDRRHANFYWMLSEIRRHVADTPFFMIPGNHDVEKRKTIDKSYYRAVMGPTYYWFGYGDTLFIAMDSSDVVEEAQFSWLSDTLKNIRPLFRHCVLVGHMPPKNVQDAETHRMSDADAARLMSIVRGHRIDVMIFGHVHYFSQGTFVGVPMYTTPSSGQTPRFTDLGKYGYITLRIPKNGAISVTPQYVDFSGPKREYLEAWIVRYLFTYRLREVINTLLIGTVVFGLAGVMAGYWARRRG